MIDTFLDKTYNKGSYNCGHFASELWFTLTGQRKYQLAEQSLTSSVQSLERLEQPENPCIVFMRNGDLHAGVFIDNLVYHLLPNGVESNSLEILSKTYSLSFYK